MRWTEHFVDDVDGGNNWYDYNYRDISEYLRLRCKNHIVATLVDTTQYVIFYRATSPSSNKVRAVALVDHRREYHKFSNENAAWAWCLATFDRLPRFAKSIDSGT